ncbi:putative lipoprotein (DUF940) [Idiomarina sp. A28L]|uniref:YjbH domain-containing protein n=1 Tax=Idiomarina sp. A28L TaxID=1036674 RepID=UPI0002138C40|nr:YjbH domain-containing protein [Idiomarina sp. A28L]EGN74597.1 putative lipoprotein (DUF940) [Idiomarina sp. A28L]
MNKQVMNKQIRNTQIVNKKINNKKANPNMPTSFKRSPLNAAVHNALYCLLALSVATPFAASAALESAQQSPQRAESPQPAREQTERESAQQRESAQREQQQQQQATQEITIELQEPARLQALLAFAEQQLNQQREQQGASAQDIYWPAARLILNDRQEEAEAARNQVMNDLTLLAQSKPLLAESLREQIQTWRLGVQTYGAPNIYKARLDLNYNPLLQAGSYTFILPSQPEHVYVYGLTEAYGKQPFVANQTVRGYMLAQQQSNVLLDEHNPEQVTLVRTSAAHRQSPAVALPWGSHNAGGHQVQPGDMLFVGLREGSAWGLLPLGKLGHSLDKATRENIPEFAENLNQLLGYFVSDSNADTTANASSANKSAAAANTLRPEHNWGQLLRPWSINQHSSWERQNNSELAVNATLENTENRRHTYNNYGSIGLIQMPTARHAEAGAFNISYNDMNEYYRYTVSVQLFDWLEASAFYLRMPNRLYSRDPSFSGTSILTDKGFDVKVRLAKESTYFPEISVGLIDFAGTGLLSSEYIAASKAWGPFDFTLGLGFGRMGTADHFKNPFCIPSSSFCDRPSGYSGRGGTLEVGQWFRGDAGLFAGVEYQTPIDRLRLKLEFESNDYSQDRAGVTINPSTAFNFGANWQLNNAIDLSLNYERGDVLTFGINITTNFNNMAQIQLNPERPAAVLADAGQAPRSESFEEVNYQRLDRVLQIQRSYHYNEYVVEEMEFNDTSYSEASQQNAENQEALRHRVTLYTHAGRFRSPSERLDRTARALLAELPTSVQEIEIVEQASKQPIVSYTFDADAYRLQIANADPDNAPEQAWKSIERTEPTPRPTNESESWALRYEDTTGAPSWGIRPHLKQGYGSPETFMFYQLMASAFSTWQIDRNWQLHGDIGINIINNYDKFNFTVDSDQSPVPRVRTFTREYSQSDVWLENLQASYYKAITPKLHVSAYGGYLEQMFGGLGAEVLYRPLNSAFSYGVDINRVRQRDFNGRFGFRDYEVTTGFASLYYDAGQHFKWLDGGLLTLSAGQFLAGDKGLNIIFQRRFDSGVTLGAFAAFTDMSTADFGEGSFNKGFFINIPFDLFTISPSRSRVNFGWSPLTRDGGQQLQRRVQLWYTTDERSPYQNRE